MAGQLLVRILVAMAVVATVLAGGACGGGSGAPDGARDGRGAGRDSGGAGNDGGGDAAQCLPAGGLTPEPAPRQVAVDGGVPIAELAHALAVARCGYLSRCYALSTYLANQCVDSLVSYESWAFETCGTANYIGAFCAWTGPTYTYPSADLLQAVATGVIQYDPQRQGQCIAALLAEECGSNGLLEELPACVGVFTCAPGTDGGASGPTDGGAADGGSSCSQLIPLSNKPLPTCSTNQDCVGVTGYPEGPNCVAGICAADALCGIDRFGCTSYAAAGQPCNANAISPLNALAAATPGGTCAPGLACDVQTADGGLGTCVVPVDVGGTCTDDTNCKPGLTCACGACVIPPSTGACVNGRCEVGVAYCDHGSNICRPVRPYGASCSDAAGSCGPGLVCNGFSCMPFSP
jgi:hypothetical protein